MLLAIVSPAAAEVVLVAAEEVGGGGDIGYSCGDYCTGVIAGSPPTIDPGTVSLGDLLPPDSPSSPPSLGIGPTPTGSTGGGIVAPKKTPSPQKPLTPQQQQRQQNCRNGALALGTGVVATIGTGVVTAIAWEDLAVVAGESLFEGGMTGLHLITGLFAAPAATVGVGFDQMVQNCGTP